MKKGMQAMTLDPSATLRVKMKRPWPLPPNTRHRPAHVLKYSVAFGEAQAPAR